MKKVILFLTIWATVFMIGMCTRGLVDKANAQATPAEQKAMDIVFTYLKQDQVTILIFHDKGIKSRRTVKRFKKSHINVGDLIKIAYIDVTKQPEVMAMFPNVTKPLPYTIVFESMSVYVVGWGEFSQEHVDNALRDSIRLRLMNKYRNRNKAF